MKLIFAGTPDFAAVSLEALLKAGFRVELALTQPDRNAGRGMAPRASPVKRLANASGIPVFQPGTLKETSAQETLRRVGADAIVVCAYGLILPQVVLESPRFGGINVHASLLPRWRGAAPISRAILAGDTETGISIMRMEAGLDTGPILGSAALRISPDETAGSLHDKLAVLGGTLLVETLDRLFQASASWAPSFPNAFPIPSRPQPDEGIRYAAKIEKSEARIDWSASAEAIDRRVRAFDPHPGAHFVWRGTTVKVWKARAEAVATADTEVGKILHANTRGVVVACGAGALRILEVQKAGGRRLDVGAFLAGNPLDVGTFLDRRA
ncbi:MAG: methionyl-tRNA formyltransferase [Candidatus Accumulibacter sp.]|jgi:methionyl-tRNA formyltransferase|nr:methionyl-tRNA formyltransferase [Accumulibacter sp.]